MNFKKFFKKDTDSHENKKNNPINFLTNNKELKNWKDDKFQSVIVQRNLLLIGLLLCFILILVALSTIRYLKNTQSIDPFVIEIEEKSGVPTVVKPLSIETYSANESIKRYFVMKYIRAREEYYSETFNRNFNDVVRVLSNSSVYYSDYRN
jgi:type IV secretion system protein VirB8